MPMMSVMSQHQEPSWVLEGVSGQLVNIYIIQYHYHMTVINVNHESAQWAIMSPSGEWSAAWHTYSVSLSHDNVTHESTQWAIMSQDMCSRYLTPRKKHQIRRKHQLDRKSLKGQTPPKSELRQAKNSAFATLPHAAETAASKPLKGKGKGP